MLAHAQLKYAALERWMSGLSHTPGKRARGKTLRGFESRLLRQKLIPQRQSVAGFYFWTDCTIFMADVIKVETSSMLLGTTSVVVASAATLE